MTACVGQDRDGGAAEDLRATPGDYFRQDQSPCALPYFFSAIKMAVPMSIIGAAIGEWLGPRAVWATSPPHDDPAGRRGGLRPIVLLSVTAMAAVGVVALLERELCPLAGES